MKEWPTAPDYRRACAGSPMADVVLELAIELNISIFPSCAVPFLYAVVDHGSRREVGSL